MKIIHINAIKYGSTGTIMRELAAYARDNHCEAHTFSRAWKDSKKSDNEFDHSFGFYLENGLHVLLAKLTGLEGSFSIFGTCSLLKKLDKIKPDIIQLHNIHPWYVNFPMLFRYIKKNHIRVIWVLHDCWSFTGHCPHFTMEACEKWKSECHNCPQHKMYPQSIVDNSNRMYRLKKKWFTKIDNLTIVTPSQWLANLTKQSFLQSYEVKVIHNGINLDIFKPLDSSFRQKNALEKKYVILGVAFGWGKRKGLDVFIELAKRLDNSKYQIVLVGTNDLVDKLLPDNIISIHKTNNQTELAELYTAADVFVNPTREDNYPTVNMESLACGTPVITFQTGGSPEIVDETCGCVVPCDDIETLQTEIERVAETKPYSTEACLYKAIQFDKKLRYQQYIDLYNKERSAK